MSAGLESPADLWRDPPRTLPPDDPYADVPHPAEYGGDDAPVLDPRAVFERDVALEARRMEVREAAARHLRARHVTPPAPPVLLSAFLAEPARDIAFRVDRLWPAGGRVVFAAQRKAGKSTAVGNLVRSLVDGEPFLGEFDVVPPAGRVTLLDFELDRDTLRRWLHDHDIQGRDRVAVDPLRGHASAFDLLDPHRRAWWAERLRRLETSVLVIDCLRPILDALGLDESHDAGRFLVAIDELLAAADIGECVVVHHAGHNGERSRGDSRLRDWPDVEWRLMRAGADQQGEEPPPDAQRFFAAEGRDVAVAEASLDYERVSRRLTLVGGNRAQLKQDRDAERALPEVIEILRTAPEPLSGRAVEAAARDNNRGPIRAALKVAVARGLVTFEPGAKGAHLHRLREVPGVG